MSAISITDESIPQLNGKVAIISGGGSGIGLATVRLLASKGARVFVLDLKAPNESTIPPPEEGKPVLPDKATFIKCDVTSWTELRAAFQEVVRQEKAIDMAFANAGIGEECDYMADILDESGELVEPGFAVVDVNFRAVVNFVKLAVSQMRKQQTEGSIVITASLAAYAPELSLPIYSATKHAVLGLVRAFRPILIKDNITINAVAPAATITSLLPQSFEIPLTAAGLPISPAAVVARALVYAATAQQERRVEDYGKDTPETDGPSRWNGRTIFTLGSEYTEIEEPLARLRPQWFGRKNVDLTRAQQAATDFREL